MSIGIIGYGVVGKAADNTFSKYYNTIKYDKYQDLDDFNSLLDCDFVFVMVPTPFDYDKNKVNQEAIIESLTRLEEIGFKNIVIIKSTVPPGSCSSYADQFNLRIVFNPEFLRESTTPNEDFANQSIVVIGVDDHKDFQNTKSLFLKVLVEDCTYHECSYEEAELIKYSQNMTLSSRVSISNLVFDACEKLGVEYSSLKKVAFDSFPILGPHMTQVPGTDGKRGFGGKCLPKDLLGFNSVFPSSILDSIIEYNESLREDIPKSGK